MSQRETRHRHLRTASGEPVQLAGERMTFINEPDGTATIKFDNKGTGRECGDCSLCCKLLPLDEPELQKPAGQKCQHQRHGKGCTIYKDRPFACRTWSCRWLADPMTAGMPRPDRCHYVIDIDSDDVVLTPHDGGAPIPLSVIVVWLDPAFPYAHREPALRTYMAMMAEKYRIATIIRLDSSRAFTIFPPALTADGEWHELGGGEIGRADLEKRLTALGAERLVPIVELKDTPDA